MDPDALREGAFGYSSFGQLQLTEETQKSTAQNIPTVPKLLEDMDAPVTAADFKAQELLYMVLGELRDALSSPSHDHLKNMNNRKLADALSIGNRGPLDPELRSRMRGFVWEMRAGYYKDEDLQRLKRRTNFVLRCIERITGYSTELSLVRIRSGRKAKGKEKEGQRHDEKIRFRPSRKAKGKEKAVGAPHNLPPAQEEKEQQKIRKHADMLMSSPEGEDEYTIS